MYTSTPANPGTTYTERGYHDVIARYYYEDIEKGPGGCSPCDGCNTDCYYFYDNWYWADPFGFSFMNGGYFGDWENLYGFGPPTEIENDETVRLGETSASLQTCSAPSGETTIFVGWDDEQNLPTVAKWLQRLTPTTQSFASRFVYEKDPGGGGPDTCWFDGSNFAPQTHISTGSGFWQVNDQNYWGPDYVGWPPAMVNYYREHGRTACGTRFPQVMQISCGTGKLDYSVTFPSLEMTIGPYLVTSRRAEGQTSRQWP